MDSRCCVLLVHHSNEPWEDLTRTMKGMGLTPCRARSCEDARHLIHELEPEVIFCETELPDGTWQRVLQLVERAGIPINVIVVGKEEDDELYLSVIEQGGQYYLTPPITPTDLDHFLRCAASNAQRRRVERATAPAA